MKTALVIPAYNEARTIRGVAERALAQVRCVAVVDDGSTDSTADALAGLPVAVLRHVANSGKGAALATGFAWALAQGADAVVTMDGDGQHRADDIARLLRVGANHRDRIVIGARLVGRERYPKSRNAANAIADFWISWAAGHRICDSQSGQRVYPAALLRAAERVHARARGFTFESAMLIHAARRGYTTIAVPIEAVHFPAGRASHFRPVRDIAAIVRMVAWQLLRRGLYPAGLWRSLRERPVVVDGDLSDRIASPSARRTAQ
jgi:glycosyltransferase involved in cell wall biosynthesis